MMINSLNVSWSDVYMLQIIIQEELEKLARILQKKKFDYKDMKFLVKVRNIHQIEKKNCICISIFGYKNKGNIQSMYQKILSKDMLIYYWYKKKAKYTIFFSKILIHSYMIRHYIVEENLQEDVEKLTRILQENLIINTRNFTSKLDIFTKLKKRIVLALVFLVIKPKKISDLCIKNYFQKTYWLSLI